MSAFAPRADGDAENPMSAETLFSLKRPRDARAGCASGIKSLLKGVASGVLGCLFAPFVGCLTSSTELQQEIDKLDERKSASARYRAMHCSALQGFLKGSFAGCVGLVCLPLGGACVCAVQVVRGCWHTPEAVAAKWKGHVWDDKERRWVADPGQALAFPAREDTRLNPLIPAMDYGASVSSAPGPDPSADDGDYYAVLGVPRTATEGQIKRAYYTLARRYHPDKNGGDAAAHARFQILGEAYQVLSQPDLRAKYDRGGRDAVDVDFDDYALMFTILFGSVKFEPVVGELMLATAASRGGDLDVREAQQIQEARVRQVADNLAARLAGFAVEGGQTRDEFAEGANALARDLAGCSYGPEMLGSVGRVYALEAEALGGGLSGFAAGFKRTRRHLGNQFGLAGTAIKVMKASFEIQNMQVEGVGEGSGGNEVEGGEAGEGQGSSSGGSGAGKGKTKVTRAELEDVALPLMLEAMWAANVMDIERTVSQACRQVPKLMSMPAQATREEKKERKQRMVSALRILGEAFVSEAAAAEERARGTVGVPGVEASGATLRSGQAKKVVQDAMFQFQEEKIKEADANDDQV